MKLSQLRNNKSPTSLKSFISIDFKVSHQYILGNLPSVRSSEWSDCLSAYDPEVSAYIYGEYPDFKNILSAYKCRHVTGRIRKMSYYRIHHYLSNNVTGYTKLSGFKR